MESRSYRVSSEAEMITLGAEVASSTRAGDILALNGDLGAGKTHFTKGLIKGFEGDDPVTSPTFALVNEYTSGEVMVCHFDFYRLESVEELVAMGWDEYLEQDAVLVVEWAEKFPEAFPAGVRWFQFTINADESRTITEERK